MIKTFRDEDRWLSNFMPVKIVLDGIEYPSVEHAYQSAKSDDMEWKSLCADRYITVGTIKRKSREVDLVLNWDIIQEGNKWGDTFWGVDLKTGEGQNHLGKLIMDIRDELINDKIDYWHEHDFGQASLREFLGFTEKEYIQYVKNRTEKSSDS
jgi:predicted NAD-dependent protein-ADP-ribosyltransferase YbiA (DUF1768 family)